MDETEGQSKTIKSSTKGNKMPLEPVKLDGKSYYDIKHDVYGWGRGYHG